MCICMFAYIYINVNKYIYIYMPTCAGQVSVCNESLFLYGVIAISFQNEDPIIWSQCNTCSSKLLISVLEWSDKYMHKCQCHQSNMTNSASNLCPKYPAHGCCRLFGSTRGFAELQKRKEKLWKTSVCAWLRTTFRLLATLFFLHCYKVFMIHLFTSMHPDAVFEQHFTFSQMTKAAEQKRSLVW